MKPSVHVTLFCLAVVVGCLAGCGQDIAETESTLEVMPETDGQETQVEEDADEGNTGESTHNDTGEGDDTGAGDVTSDGDQSEDPSTDVTDGQGEDDPSNSSGASGACSGVQDSATGLCWEDPSYLGLGEGGVTWAEAVSYCESLNAGEHDDWRMPNVNEVRSIIRGCPSTEADGACSIVDGSSDTLFSEACNGCLQFGGPNQGCYWTEDFSGPCPGNVWLWTSSESVDPGFPFFYDPSVGRLGRTFDVFPMAVRCVRGGL